jgi:SMI1/KNR4 family protein SUKH-1
MNPLVQFLKQTQGTVYVGETRKQKTLRLLPPQTEQELSAFEASLPCALPGEMRELLRFASGFEGAACRLGHRFEIEEIRFADTNGFGLEDVFPHGKELAVDGCGNSWVVDLSSESKAFAPIFFSCHDPPVVVYQTDSLLHLVREIVRGSSPPWRSQIADVHEGLATRIWRENPCAMSRSQCLALGDYELKAFAEPLDETWEFIDLRNPKMGDGYSWGRYGGKTVNKRYGNRRIFACQKKSLGRRFIEAFR